MFVTRNTAAERAASAGLVWVGAFVLVASCSTPPTGGAPQGSKAGAGDAGVGAAEADPGPVVALPPLAASLGYAQLRRAQSAAGPAYAVRPSPEGRGALTTHPSQNLRALFVAEGVHLAGKGERWRARLRLTDRGRPGQLDSVGAATPVADGTRVSYDRGDVAEWYLHGPLGIEQGFTVAERPPGAGPLLLAVEVEGALVPRLLDERRVVLEAPDGRVRFTYTDLFVRDAAGNSLPAEMRVHGRHIYLVVDDEAARYPLEVDPLLADSRKIRASDGASSDAFGDEESVAVSGDTIIVGAPNDDDNGSASGSAYLYVNGASGWYEQVKLVPSGSSASDLVGDSVGASGNRFVTGAPQDSPSGVSSGALWAWHRGSTSVSYDRLVATDGSGGDRLGVDSDISGGTIVGGAYQDDDLGSESGSAYVFVLSSGSWSEQTRLNASDGAAGDRFGWDVAIDGDTIVATAPRHDHGPTDAGAAYVLTRDTGVWSEQAELLASDGEEGDEFGNDVDIDADTVVVGSADHNGNTGAAYVFVRSGTTWTEQAKLTASDGDTGDRFGTAVAVDGDLILVGARFDEPKARGSGSAYLFARRDGVWTQRIKIVPSDGAEYDYFGEAVAIDGDTAVVSAGGDDDRGSGSGSIYVYRLSLVNDGDPCSRNRECWSRYCVDGVCCADACNGGAADDCLACSTAAGAAVDGVCGTLDEATAPTVECRPAAGACDVPETCTAGVAECPADSVAAADTPCRAAAGPCDVAEACDGSSATCPADDFVANGTDCDDGMVCNGPDSCVDGTCAHGTAPDCDDGDPCTADMCSEPGGCANEPIAGCCTADADCDDGDPCTTDTCEASNTCSNEPSCEDAGAGDAGTGSDGGTSPDGGATRPDGGTTEPDAGGTRPDGGAAGEDAGGTSRRRGSGGCGCRTAPARSRPEPGAPLLLGLTLAAVLRRRRAPPRK